MTSSRVKTAPEIDVSTRLRKGYTTGACATAAAKAAAYALILEKGIDTVDVTLPTGDTVLFRVQGVEFTEDWARATVIKDAGDDPDITNGAEIGAEVAFYTKGFMVAVGGGTGVGTVTKPGLAVPVGQSAINPVPMKMIKDELMKVLKETDCPLGLDATIFVPKGEELAKKTLNSRLGIVGGISILGTTGIVEPISARAWTDTVTAAMDVARACGVEHCVLTPGRTSENAAMRILTNLTEEAFIQMGDHVGFALAEARKKGFSKVTIVGQFGKLVKMAMGHTKTHASDSTLELGFLSGLGEKLELPKKDMKSLKDANTARDAFLRLHGPSRVEFSRAICDNVKTNVLEILGDKIVFSCIMVDYEGEQV